MHSSLISSPHPSVAVTPALFLPPFHHFPCFLSIIMFVLQYSRLYISSLIISIFLFCFPVLNSYPSLFVPLCIYLCRLGTPHIKALFSLIASAMLQSLPPSPPSRYPTLPSAHRLVTQSFYRSAIIFKNASNFPLHRVSWPFSAVPRG